MTFSILLSAVLIATSAVASPMVNVRGAPSSMKISSSISLHSALNIGSNGDVHAIINSDRKRFQALKTHGQAKLRNLTFSTEVPVSDVGPLFVAEVGVGSPATTYQLIVDTGSSNTFVGANTSYQTTQSSKDTGHQVSVSYGSGAFSGEEFTDTVTLGNASIDGQSIGVTNVTNSVGFQGFDGILGLGPTGLTEGTIVGEDSVPTVTDNLAKQGKASAALVGISFPPAASSDSGSLDFGEPNTDNFIGDVSFTPITKTSPSSAFWGIDQSITYGDNTKLLDSSAGIVDTGTTLLYIASDAFQTYVSATGATQDGTTGLLKIDNPDKLQSMFFKIGDTTLEFTADAQMWPRSLNSVFGANSDETFLVVADIGIPSGQGMDVINGFTFLQRFYSVYDTTNSQVGFASTKYTNATINAN